MTDKPLREYVREEVQAERWSPSSARWIESYGLRCARKALEEARDAACELCADGKPVNCSKDSDCHFFAEADMEGAHHVYCSADTTRALLASLKEE